MYPKTLILVLGLSSLVPIAGQAGTYRPVEQAPTSHAQGELPPPQTSGNPRWSQVQPLPSPTLPATPPAGGYYPTTPYAGGYYAPPAYAPPASDRSTNGFTLPVPNPGNFLDDFFGSRDDDRRTAYPPAPPVAPVTPYGYGLPAPAYGGYYGAPGTLAAPAPLPATAPPQPVQPAQPSAPAVSRPTASASPQRSYRPQPTTAAASRHSASSQGNWRPPAESQPTHPSTTITSRDAPRPFSNPQTSGNLFPMREPPQVGRNDPRFRPPELKGTP